MANPRNTPNQGPRGSDLRFDLPIDLEEVFNGAKKEISIERLTRCETCSGTGDHRNQCDPHDCEFCSGAGHLNQGLFRSKQPCSNCLGTGRARPNPCTNCCGTGCEQKDSRIKLNIPVGIREGNRLRSKYNGDVGERGGPPGDLYIVIFVKPHDVFDRDGNDLYCEAPLASSIAATGGELTIQTMAGPTSVKIPAGTEHNTSFCLREMGIPDVVTSCKGNLFVAVQVEPF